MIVKCIANDKKDIESKFWTTVDDYIRKRTPDLLVGSTYIVYGLMIRDEHVWYLICEEAHDDYPKLHLGAFFEPTDLSIPQEWAVCLKPNNLGQGVSILPKRWADDPLFLERLVDGCEESQNYFRALKASLQA